MNLRGEIKIHTNKSKKINNLRVLAIILVVLGHSIIIYSSNWNLYETLNKVVFLDYLKRFLDIVPMPLFFSISGYLFFLSHKKYPQIIKFIIKKFKRLIIPFFCIGIFYLLPIRKVIGYSGYIGKSFCELFVNNFLMASDVGHLWYLPALFFVFIISELILFIVEKIPYICKKSEIVFLIVSFILYLEGYRISFSYPPLMSAYTYIFWFSLGFFINVRSNLFDSIYKNKFIEMFLVLSSLIGLIYYGLNENIILILSLGIRIILIINLFELMTQKSNKLLEIIGENSFGIYLFHSPLVYITFCYFPNINPLIMVFINFFIYGLIALILSLLIRKTKLKFIIGE